MEAKLIKTFFDGWTNYHLKNKDGVTIATTKHPFSDEQLLLAKGKGVVLNKLSIKNCQAIENGYDLDELAEEYATGKSSNSSFRATHIRDFKEGFQKALEIKKFSVSDMEKLMFATIEFTEKESGEVYPFFIDFLQSTGQTEWEVRVETVDSFTRNGEVYFDEVGKGNYSTHSSTPKLDENNCLILKKL
jgi:hypothetical protein